MQYILTSEEYEELLRKGRMVEGTTQAIINELCMRVAENEPVDIVWGGKTHTQAWGCRHSTKNKKCDYCDQCPSQEMCKLPKNWSK